MATLLLLGVSLTSCTGLPEPHLDSNVTSLLETRVAILSQCPMSRAESRTESAAGTAIVSALIPPLVDTALTTTGNAIKALAEEREEVFEGQTVGRFYSSNRATTDFTSAPYDIVQNNELGCVVVIHGYFSDDNSNVPTLDGFSPRAARLLQRHFGIAVTPVFYFEGGLVYSNDRAGFRVSTESILYNERLMDHKPGLRELEIQFTFGKPSGSDEGKSFAVGKIDLGIVDDELLIRNDPLLGYSMVDPAIQTSLGTGYLPLPALEKSTKDYIVGAKARLSTLGTLLDETIVKLRALGGPHTPHDSTDVDRLLTFLDGATTIQFLETLRVTTESEIQNLKVDIEELKRSQDSELLNAQYALSDIRDGIDTDLEKAEKAVERRELFLENVSRLSSMESQLQTLIARKNDIRAMASRSETIRAKLKEVSVDSQTLRYVQPFTLNVALKEKRPENPVWSFVSSVFSGAEDGIEEALLEEIDPSTRQKLEDEAKAADEELLNSQDTAKKNAITAVMDYKGKEIELQSLAADATALTKNTKEKELAIAEIDAQIACRKAKDLSVDPPGCGVFL